MTNGAEREVVDDILKKLTNLTQKDVQLTSGDLTAASSTLLGVSDHAKERVDTVSSDQLEVTKLSMANHVKTQEETLSSNQPVLLFKFIRILLIFFTGLCCRSELLIF